MALSMGLPSLRLHLGTYLPILLRWSVPAAIAILFVGERLPMVRRDLFCHLPLVGRLYEDYRDMDGD